MSHPTRRTALLVAAAAAASGLVLPTAFAQTWPSRPIKLIVPFPAGGGTDIVARLLAERLGQALGQNVVVDNRPGAGTAIGAAAVASAPADGHTLLFSGSTTFTVNPAVRRHLSYDPFKQLQPLGLVARAPLVVVTAAGSPYADLPQLLAAARNQPGALNYATFGTGTGPHLVGEMLAHTRSAKMVPVPYKGSADALVGILRGDVQMGIDTLASAKGQIDQGKLRALAVISEKRTPLMPQVPSLGELGLGDALFEAWYAMAAPAGLEPGVAARLEKALARIAADTDFRQQLVQQSMDGAWLAPAGLKALMDKEVARYRAAVARSNMPQS
ncbi:tripartite tricarboxylate transporter substrate binding protein [Hydrogenophaga sp.]|uniref:Bug family tripartite tricarboxylate transporter substrate binding protein n=1 Tax=Hydrogenophaga sp. TaxID=1904254 RepID=UPI00286DF87F|nr:tripartite tricarboxylate transporter substrate binding protein [Hydrogenophaga sp.]